MSSENRADALQESNGLQAKTWVLGGGIAALLALILTYFVLEPAPTTVSYGSILGWAGIFGVAAILVQGFRKFENRQAPSDASGKLARLDSGLIRWGGIHTAFSIAVTVLIAVHAAIFFASLWAASLTIWLGATGFVALLVLNASGLATESKRKSRQFGSLKRIHVILMLAVLLLSILHIELLLGITFPRSAIDGAIIILAVLFVVLVSVPITLTELNRSTSQRLGQSEVCQVYVWGLGMSNTVRPPNL